MKIKRRDKFLFFLPALLGVMLVAGVLMLFWLLHHFEKSYLALVEEDIAVRSRLMGMIVQPLIERDQWGDVREFCASFCSDYTRVTVIDRRGKVMAESQLNPETLGSHGDRPEVQAALQGRPGSVTRYSATMNSWMVYYAIPLETAAGSRYVLRISEDTQAIMAVVALGWRNVLLAMLVGGSAVLLLTLYILSRVRRPLNALQVSASRIAGGDLQVEIPVPDSGVVRDLARVVSSMADQLKHHLRRVTAERNLMDTIFNTMAEAVLLVEADGNICQWNHRAGDIFALSPGQKSFHVARCTSPELLDYVRQAFRGQPPPDRELAAMIGDKRLILLVKGVKMEREGKELLLLTISDLTGLRKLESFRSDFVANVSHEIKTPLTGIVSAVETLEDGALQNPAMAQTCLDILGKQCRRLNSLVSDILSLAALEQKHLNGKKNFEVCKVDVVLASAAHLCLEAAQSAGVEITYGATSRSEVFGDRQLLEQAVVNLLTNAIKYSGSPRIEIACEDRDNKVLLCVRDWGIGIPREHHARIFERFYRVHKERSRDLGGTGLGLSIVKHIALLHGGSVAVESSPGRGCLFTLTLPQAPR